MRSVKEDKRRVELQLVGKIRGFAVYDLFYFQADDPAPGLKSILVQTAPGAYREIYHDVPTEGRPNPSFLVIGGRDTLLCVADNIQRWDAEEQCFCFTTNGIVRLDCLAKMAILLAGENEVGRPASTGSLENSHQKISFANFLRSSI